MSEDKSKNDLVASMFNLFYEPGESCSVLATKVFEKALLWEAYGIDLLTKSPNGGNTIFHLMVCLPYSDKMSEICQELNQRLPRKSDLPKVLNNSGKTVYDLSKDFDNNSVLIYDTIYIFCKVEYYY